MAQLMNIDGVAPMNYNRVHCIPPFNLVSAFSEVDTSETAICH